MTQAIRNDKASPLQPSGGLGLQTVVEALDRLRFGAIQLTIHDGKLVQVDVTERHRYAA